MRKVMSWSAVLVGSVAAWGCAHAPKVESTDKIVQAPASAPRVDKQVEAPPSVADADADVEAVLRNDVLHFSFNESGLTRESEVRLRKVSEVMRSHPAVRIQISGNCDERGTEEYNLALGQQRADAARRYLTTLGVDGSRLATVSYGKEHPLTGGHDESSWSQNRRDDLAVARN